MPARSRCRCAASKCSPSRHVAVLRAYRATGVDYRPVQGEREGWTMTTEHGRKTAVNRRAEQRSTRHLTRATGHSACGIHTVRPRSGAHESTALASTRSRWHHQSYQRSCVQVAPEITAVVVPTLPIGRSGAVFRPDRYYWDDIVGSVSFDDDSDEQIDRFGRGDGIWWVTSGSTLRNVPANGRRSNKGDVGVMTVGLAGGISRPAHLRGAAGRARRTSRAFMTLDARGFVRFGPVRGALERRFERAGLASLRRWTCMARRFFD